MNVMMAINYKTFSLKKISKITKKTKILETKYSITINFSINT